MEGDLREVGCVKVDWWEGLWTLGGGRLGLGEEEVSFICKKFSFLFLFLFTVEGLGFFFFTFVVVLVSRLKQKEEPMVIEREVVWPWERPKTHMSPKSQFAI